MLSQGAKVLGRQVVSRAVDKQVRDGNLDSRRGLALLRDPRVPFRAKAVALLAGFGFWGVLNALEMPVEAAIALAMPMIGWPPLLVWNGIELVVVPLAVASLLLTRAAVRREREVQTALPAPPRP